MNAMANLLIGCSSKIENMEHIFLISVSGSRDSFLRNFMKWCFTCLPVDSAKTKTTFFWSRMYDFHFAFSIGISIESKGLKSVMEKRMMIEIVFIYGNWIEAE